MESKKINQLATAVNPSTSDLAIIGDPVTGVSKKITWLQVSTLIGTAANLQQVTDNGATTTNAINIGGLTITGLSTGVLKSDSGVISSVPFGAANGVATLAGDGKVPSSQLPSYVDDVVEVANYAALPVTGETGKIYITLDNNKVYRWGGSVYVEIAANNAIWGSITGTLANQTDLQNALDAKANDSAVVHLAGTETITGTKTFSNPSKNDGGILLKNGASYSLSGYMNLGGMTDGLRFTSGGGVSNFFTLPSSVGYTYTFPAISGTIVAISGGNSTQYIDGTGALQTFPTLLSSDNLVKLVRNQSGATMTAGTIVYISGATGNKPLITKAIATGDATSAQTYGIVQANIANNADGYVVIIGNVNDIDTSALTEGQQLYLSGTTAGTWTTTKPYAPIHLVYVGIVLRSHPTQGIIGVKIQNGYEMDELHNVDAQSPSNNDILSYNTTTSLWEHKQIATTLGFTPISLASLSAVSPLIYNNGTGAFSIQVATASQNGYLSSTDWSTFNNKQAALGGTGFVKISGSTISYDNSTYYLASNPSGFITLASLSAGAGISYSNITGVISSTITQYTDALARAAFSESVVGLDYSSSTGVLSTTTGYSIPTTAKQTEWDTAYTNRITSLTTTGTSGAATLVANTLNIPNYGSALSGYVTLATSQTISANKTFSEFGFFDKGVLIKQGNYPASSGYNGIGAIGGGFYFGMGQTSVHLLSFSTTNSYNYTFPNATGTLALTSDIVTYTLPIATSSVLGGVKIGTGVSIDVNGVISVSTNYQAPLNGTGFVKASGTTITYDNSTYLTTSSASSTYLPLAGGVLTGALTLNYSTPTIFLNDSADAGIEVGIRVSGENFEIIEPEDTNKVWFKIEDDGDGFLFGNKIYNSANSNTITSLGTITTGVWNATAISDTYISSAATWNAKQAALNGTGFVKATGTTITYDNSTYLTTSSAASTYVPYTGATGNVNLGSRNLLLGSGNAGGHIDLIGSTDTAYLNIESAGAQINYNSSTIALTDKQFGGTLTLSLRPSLTTGNAFVQTFQAATGTIALTSQIPSLTGYVTGSGTNNKVAKFTSTGSTIGSSVIEDDGTYTAISGAVSNSGMLTIYNESAFSTQFINIGTGGATWQVGATNNAYGSGGGKFVFTYGAASLNSILTLIQATKNVSIGTTDDVSRLYVVGAHTSGRGIISVNSTDIAYLHLSSSSADATEVGVRYAKSNVEKWVLGMVGGTTSDYTFRLLGSGLATNVFNVNLTTGVTSYNYGISGTTANFSSSVTATSFVKTGGTASQYLMADGSVTTGGAGGSQWSTTASGIYYNGAVSIATTQFSTNSKLLVGDYLSLGTSAIAQFNGFLRIKGQLIIHDDANTALEQTIVCTASRLYTPAQFSVGTSYSSAHLSVYQGSASTTTIDQGIVIGNGNGNLGVMAALRFGTYGNEDGSMAYAKQFIAGVRDANGAGFGDLILGNYKGDYAVANATCSITDTAIRIKKSGNVIIGAHDTTDIQPTFANVKLQVNGSFYLSNTASDSGQWINAGTGGWSFIQYRNMGTDKFIQGYRDADGLFHITAGATLSTNAGFNMNSSSRVNFGGSSFNGIVTIQGSHVGGYGMLNMESSDACLISMNSSTSYDVRIRYKYQSVDQWYVGMIDNTSFKWQNADSATRLTLTQAGTLTAAGDVVAYSDIRFKENIRPIENVLNRIGESRGVLYDRKDSGVKDNIGFIAQELELQFPELVNTDNDGIKSVKYQNAVAILFEAIKEQQKQIDNLKKQAA